MNSLFKKIAILTLFSIHFSCFPKIFSGEDHAEIIKTYWENTALFEIKYMSKQFSATGTYDSIVGDSISSEYVIFTNDTFGRLQCSLGRVNKNSLREIAEFKKGDKVTISGQIFMVTSNRRTEFIAIVPCKYKKVN